MIASIFDDESPPTGFTPQKQNNHRSDQTSSSCISTKRISFHLGLLGLLSKTKCPQRAATTPHTCQWYVSAFAACSLALLIATSTASVSFVICPRTRLLALWFVHKICTSSCSACHGIHDGDTLQLPTRSIEYAPHHNKHTGHERDTRTTRETPLDCRLVLPHAARIPTIWQCLYRDLAHQHGVAGAW